MCAASHLKALILPADGSAGICTPSANAPPRCHPLCVSCLLCIVVATSKMKLSARNGCKTSELKELECKLMSSGLPSESLVESPRVVDVCLILGTRSREGSTL